MKKQKNIKKLYWKFLEAKTNLVNLFNDHYDQVRVFFILLARSNKHRDLEGNQFAKKMLFISFYSPPYASYFGTQRLTKFLKYWNRKGWDITLLTTAPKPGTPQDTSSELEETNVHIVRTLATSFKSIFLGNKEFIPDNYIHWIRPAVSAADQIIQSEKPSVIVATVPPYSNAIAAKISAHKHGLPLVIDFRDPWTCIDVVWVIRNKFLRYLNGLIEKSVLNFSQLVIIADELEYLSSFFPNGDRWKHKVKSITNGYDEEDFSNILLAHDCDDYFKISYIGGIYDEETFINITAPIREWVNQHPDDLSSLKLVYAGNSKFFDNDSSIPFKIENYGTVSHDEAIKLRFESHVQLFAQPSHFKPHVYSGKIFEMIRTPVPILAITNPLSSPAKLIKTTNTGVVFAPEDVHEAAFFLKTTFEKWKAGKSDYSPDKDKITAFSRKNLAHQALVHIEQSIQEYK